jgi:peptidoglycan/xylan/chitin deacetylase (PgdA/CDA1 family)
MVKRYDAIRNSASAQGGDNMFRVTNSFVNVRSEPRSNSANLGRFNGGDLVPVLDFVNAGWAKVQMPDGKTGYIALQYLGKMTTDDKLEQEKAVYKGVYYVHYAFVNVRTKPDQQSEKMGQIFSQEFVKPLSVDKQWARVSLKGKEGYVSTQYLAPFIPKFIVRQDKFTVPILHYRMDDKTMLTTLGEHVTKLKQAGYTFLTLRDVRDILVSQESRDVRVPPKSVIIAITNVKPDTVRSASDVLYGAGVPATFFLQTKDVGLSGITEKTILTLLANGFDIQSSGHTGDDLRALTDAQVKLEVEQSRKLIEDLTKRDVFAIDYPQGGVNERVMQRAAEAGYLFGIGNAPDKVFTRSQFLRLPSFAILTSMTADDILNAVK